MNSSLYGAALVLLATGCWFLNPALQSDPVIFGAGVISTRDYESSITFEPDGQVAYFVKSTPDLSFRVIVFSRFDNGKWSTPEVAPFSGVYSDTDPFLSPDGKQLFFASRRPVEGTTAKVDFDLWVVEKTHTGWGEPRHLGATVNSESQETSPSVAKDGTLYFSSTRAGGKGSADLYRAKLAGGNSGAPENLGDAINSPGPEIQVFINPDEQVLIFATAGRNDSRGSVDLYLSKRTDGAWSTPANLGDKINSSGVDSAPRISPDGKHFFWTSTRGYGFEDQQVKPLTFAELSTKLQSAGNSLGDIYQIDLKVLPL